MRCLHMLRLALWSCMLVCVCAFMPMLRSDMQLRTPLRCLPQNASLYSELLPIAMQMSSMQMEVLLALFIQKPLQPQRIINASSVVDYGADPGSEVASNTSATRGIENQLDGGAYTVK